MFNIDRFRRMISKLEGRPSAGPSLHKCWGYPYKMSKKGKLVINAKTAKKYKVEFPYDILSTAEKIYE